MSDDPLILIALLVAVLIAALTQGTTGFGFALVAVPPMAILVDPEIVVPALLVQTLMTGTLILIHARKHVRIRRMGLLSLSGVAGVPAGTAILVVLDAEPLRVIIGARWVCERHVGRQYRLIRASGDFLLYQPEPGHPRVSGEHRGSLPDHEHRGHSHLHL